LAPTILVGVFDQDLSAKMSLEVPQIYLKGIRQKLFRTERLWIYIAHGIWDSLVLYFAIVFMTGEGSFKGGKEYDYVSVSTMMAHSAIFVINIFATANWSTWTFITRFAFYISIGFWIAYTLVYYSVSDSIAYGTSNNVLNTPNFYLVFFLAVAMCLLPKFVIKFTQQTFSPSDTDILKEAQANMKSIAAEEAPAEEDIVSFDSSPHASTGSGGTTSASPEKPKLYINSTDGFEGEPISKTPISGQWPKTMSPGSSLDTSSNHDRTSSIQQVFQKGVHFFNRLKNEPKNRPKIAHRSSSIVYMNGKSRQGIANTGFAFSQEPGMQDIITPHRETIEDDKGSIGKINKFAKLRNISNSIQSIFGLGISRNNTPVPRDIQDRQSIDSLPNPSPKFIKTSIESRNVSALSKKQRIAVPEDVDDDESSHISRRSVNSETGSRSSPTRQLPFIPERGQK
jgi:Phospholipid-translocating P-type ATPase C-terminal